MVSPLALERRVALITGSSRGLGREIAYEFANKSYHVLVHCNKSKGEALKVVQEILTSNGSAELLPADLTLSQDRIGLMKEVQHKVGRLDVLVNNAAIYKCSVKDLDYQQNYFELKIPAVSELMDLAINLGVKSICNISSMTSECPRAEFSFTGAIQSGLVNLTKAYAKKYAGKIQFNNVSPGYMNTNMIAKNYTNEQISKFLEHVPVNRLIEPREVARVVSFLAETPLISGQNIIIDGGYHLVN